MFVSYFSTSFETDSHPYSLTRVFSVPPLEQEDGPHRAFISSPRQNREPEDEETPPSPAGSWWQVTDAQQDTEPTRTENSQGQTQDGPW